MTSLRPAGAPLSQQPTSGKWLVSVTSVCRDKSRFLRRMEAPARRFSIDSRNWGLYVDLVLKTYGFLSKKYYLWASFFQFIISRNLFYWIAPQLIFTSSQKKSRRKFLKMTEVRDKLRKFFEIFWKSKIFENFRKIENFRNHDFSKIIEIPLKIENYRKCSSPKKYFWCYVVTLLIFYGILIFWT